MVAAAPNWTYEVAVPPAAQLGEGPRWDPVSDTLLWVDILGRRVHRFDPVTGADAAWAAPGPVSLALPRRRGGVVVGLPGWLYLLDDLGGAPLVPLEADILANRSNDGACDARGRLWVGTMALDERSPSAALYRVDADLRVTRVLAGTTISNGVGWSPDGERFSFIDSPTRRVDVFACDPETGALSARRPLASIKADDAVPDGMTVDAEGCLWVALHGGWGLNRYSPRVELLSEVRLPVARVTSCYFGGRELTGLYVTTCRESLSDAELAQQPLAGALLRRDPGVTGLPTNAFAGSAAGRRLCRRPAAVERTRP